MLSKLLVALLVFILCIVVFTLAGLPFAGLIALAVGIIAFLVAPARRVEM